MVPLWNVGAPSLPSAEAGRSPFFSVSSCLRVPFSYGSHSEGDGGLGASGLPCGPDLGECGGGGAGAATPGGALGGEGVALGHRLSPNGPLPCGSEGPPCQLSSRLSYPIFETSFLGSSFGHFGEGTRGIMAFALGRK